MLVKFVINGKIISLDENPNEKLSSVLRKFNLFSIKKGCSKGKCGFCTILLNGKTALSCKIPIGILNENSKIETLEEILTKEDSKFIMAGFRKAKIHLCGYCNASKILFAYEYIQKNSSKDELLDFAKNLSCTCTEEKSFIEGVIFAKALKKAEIEEIN